MRIIKTLLFLMLKVLNIFFLPMPVRKNRVVFASYFSKTPEGNLKCVLDALHSGGKYEIKTLFLKYDRSFTAKIKYFFNTFRELYYFNTSRLVVLEGNSAVLGAIHRKKNVFALQLWHAAGAFKKFGQDTQRLYAIRGLNAAVVSSHCVAGIYAQALNIPEEAVYVLGIPRLDVLFIPGKTEEYARVIREKYPMLAGKKIALYAPTFRGRGVNDIQNAPIDLQAVAAGLPEDYALAVRLHPLMRGSAAYAGFADLSGEDLIAALSTADVLITDYSSIIFEYSALMRPMLFFAPDLEEYTRSRGFYKDYASFVPGKICRDEKTLAQAVRENDFNAEKIPTFANAYIEFRDGRCTARVVSLIDCIMRGETPSAKDFGEKID
jgi:CDP-ribitol ribitolphosphotransferase